MSNDRPFRIASFLTVVFPLLLVSTVASDIALSAVAALFILRSYVQKDWNWCREGWVRLLTALWLYMMARSLLSEHPKEALSRALPFVRYIVFAAALARWTLADDGTRRHFLKCLWALVVFMAADGLLQYLAGYDALMHRIIHDPNNGHIRLTGIFTKPMLGIMLAWLAFPALLPGLFAGAPLRGGRMAGACAGTVIALAAIALSGERMALILTLSGCVVTAFLLRLRMLPLLAGVASLVLVLGALALAAPDMFARQVDSTRETLSHWQQSPYGMLLTSDLAVAGQQPLWGVGTGLFREHCETLYAGDAAKITAMCNTHPHNIWLEWLIEEGIIGLCFFAAFVFIVYRDCIAALPYVRGNPVFIGFFVAFTLRVWPFMSTTGFFSRWGAPPFWLVLGALLVYTAGKGRQNAGASLTVEDAGF